MKKETSRCLEVMEQDRREPVPEQDVVKERERVKDRAGWVDSALEPGVTVCAQVVAGRSRIGEVSPATR